MKIDEILNKFEELNNKIMFISQEVVDFKKELFGISEGELMDMRGLMKTHRAIKLLLEEVE